MGASKIVVAARGFGVSPNVNGGAGTGSGLDLRVSGAVPSGSGVAASRPSRSSGLLRG